MPKVPQQSVSATPVRLPRASLELHGLVKRFAARDQASGHVAAVDGVDLEVEPGRMFALLGPSGCGKTTTLRCIAGLEEPDAGRIKVGDRVLFDRADGIDVGASQRGLGVVFQSYAIWPHLDVFGNVSFPLQVLARARRPGRREIAERVERVLEVVQLADLARRPATDLSGGQQQRLALARALIVEPPLLLLDEPLSNLDATLRQELRFELKRLQREVGVTTIFVTHDQLEALAISNRMGVMADGRIQQTGRPRDLYQRPANRFVANFLGAPNLLDGNVSGRGSDGTVEVATSLATLRVRTDRSLPRGAPVTVIVRPEHLTIRLVDDDPAPTMPIIGEVVTRAFLGDAVEHLVRAGDHLLRVRSDPRQSHAPGTPVVLEVAAGDGHLVERER